MAARTRFRPLILKFSAESSAGGFPRRHFSNARVWRDQAKPSSSVDPTELSHFDALASSWWDPHGPSRLLHLMNPLRHDFISDCLLSSTGRTSIATEDAPSAPPRSLRYLDIGCGGGIFAESAARLPTTRSVLAVDPSKAVLAVAEAHAAQDPALCARPALLTYRNASVEALAEAERGRADAERADVVAVWEVVEHVEHPGAFLDVCMQHVRPGGWLVGSTIAKSLVSWLVHRVAAEEVLGIVPRGTHDWEKFVDEKRLRAWSGHREDVVEDLRTRGCLYVPGLGWKWVEGGEKWGNYFFGIRKRPATAQAEASN